MSISQAALAWLYFYALLLGVALAAIYDVLRITRVFLGVHYSRRTAKRLLAITLPLLPPRKRKTESHALGIVVFLEDLVFCLLTGISLVLLFYECNNGKFRFPALLCTGIGFLIYRGTIGRLVMLFSEVIAFLVETLFRYLLFFSLFPFRFIGNWISKRFRDCATAAAQSNRKRLRRKFTALQRTRLERNACGMIPHEMEKKTEIVKRGKHIGKNRKKTVQPDASDASASRRSGGGVNRHIREERDAL